MLDFFEADLIGSDIDTDRVREQSPGQFDDARWHRGREEQRLAPFRQVADDPLEIRQKAHIEHAVGLVQDEDFELIEVNVALVHQVQQSARRGDQDVGPPIERPDLARLVHSAEDHRLAEVQVSPVGRETVADLDRQFAGRGQRQHEGVIGRCLAVVRAEAIEDGDGEGGGLAGARLGTAQHVTSPQCRGNRLGLDRRGGLVLLIGKCLSQGCDEIEVSKCRQGIVLPGGAIGDRRESLVRHATWWQLRRETGDEGSSVFPLAEV